MKARYLITLNYYAVYYSRIESIDRNESIFTISILDK